MLSTTRTGRYDGTTMGELVTERFNTLMTTVETLQGHMEHYEECGLHTPDDIVRLYQESLDSLEEYADYWGFDC